MHIIIPPSKKPGPHLESSKESRRLSESLPEVWSSAGRTERKVKGKKPGLNVQEVDILEQFLPVEKPSGATVGSWPLHYPRVRPSISSFISTNVSGPSLLPLASYETSACQELTTSLHKLWTICTNIVQTYLIACLELQSSHPSTFASNQVKSQANYSHFATSTLQPRANPKLKELVTYCIHN